MGPDQQQNDEHKNELPDLNADVEEQERDRQRRLRDAERRQRGGKAKTMQKAERERDHPRIARGQPRLAALKLHDLDPDEHDAQRDRRIERTLGYTNPAKGRGSERQAVPHRKGGDGVNQHPPAADQPYEAEHKQEMDNPQQDLADTVLTVNAS